MLNKFKLFVYHPIKRSIAKYYLVILRKCFRIKVIGVTGSSGKTSTKDMLASILGLEGNTVASFANIDPVYNIPSTILRCTPFTKYLVLEMGVEHRGEMRFYMSLAKPDVAVITNIYPTHLLFFKDERGVAREKEIIVQELGNKDTAILNIQNRYTKEIGKRTKAEVIWFGSSGDVYAKNIEIDKNLNTDFELFIDDRSIRVKLPILGSQFVDNALAASGAAFALGIEINTIKKGLMRYKRPEHRMNVLKLRNGSVIIDDSYNNNPSAAKEALKTFKSVISKRKSILIFGDMLELGKNEEAYHKEVGKLIGFYKFNYVIGVGGLSKFLIEEVKRTNKNATWVKSYDDVLPVLKPLLKKGTITLIKGSRSVGLDRIVSALS